MPTVGRRERSGLSTAGSAKSSISVKRQEAYSQSRALPSRYHSMMRRGLLLRMVVSLARRPIDRGICFLWINDKFGTRGSHWSRRSRCFIRPRLRTRIIYGFAAMAISLFVLQYPLKNDNLDRKLRLSTTTRANSISPSGLTGYGIVYSTTNSGTSASAIQNSETIFGIPSCVPTATLFVALLQAIRTKHNHDSSSRARSVVDLGY